MTTRVKLSEIAFDAGTQVRAAINEQVVTDYADRMRSGIDFPPVVLFHDGNQHYLADGFHRAMATQRVGWKDISAEVKPGTKQDALWFALGANERNGLRMTPADKRHAIVLALESWPEKSVRQLAEQIGVSSDYASLVKSQVQSTLQLPDRVTGKDGKSYPASRSSVSEAKPVDPRRPAVEARIKAGERIHAIAKAERISTETVTRIKREMGLLTKDLSRLGNTQRLERMRSMADEGYTSRQIADALGLSEQGCRSTMRREAIDVPADRTVGKAKHHDATRIIEHIVMDAENLTADVNLIDFDDLDPRRLPEWIQSLTQSRKSLDVFIRQLVKEQQKHEAA